MHYPEKILKQKIDKNGYCIVRLSKDGKLKDFKVHRLVLIVFNPIENMDRLQVNHIDGE